MNPLARTSRHGGTVKKAAARAALLLVSILRANAATVREENRYYTDFKDASVTNDFCPGSAILYKIDESNGTTTYAAVENGALTLSSEWGRLAGAALIAGGGQWDAPGVVVGKDDIMGEPYGVFRDTIATITYTFETPASTQLFDLHTNMVVMLQARKRDSPYTTRRQSYFARYDGVRFSLCEYTFSASSQFREIDGKDVALASNSSLIKMRVSALGGSDGVFTGGSQNWNMGDPITWTQTGQSPVMLEASLWVNGALAASLGGQDNPFDWEKGPDQDGAVFDPPPADWGFGQWLLPGGEEHKDWGAGYFINRGDNRGSISEKGWTGVVYHQEIGTQAPNIPKVYVHSYEVVNTLAPRTILMLR